MNEALLFSNENFNAAIVIMAASLLLYNLVRNIYDRVTRTAAAMLACVTIVYTGESLAGLEPEVQTLEALYRLQWIGIAFMPVTIFHLADALLATTGRPSRGRRRLTVRLLYALSALTAALALGTDLLIQEMAYEPVSYLAPGPLFHLYTLYFALASGFAWWFVARARARCLTPYTRRRMTGLLLVFLAPGLGIFPYSSFFASFTPEEAAPLSLLLLAFNLANLAVIAALIYLAYPLSFFGNNKPDRLIKAELLQFLLQGPFTATLILVAMVTAPRLAPLVGIRGSDLAIVSVVGVLLGTQWGISLLLPWLEDRLIYNADQAEARRLRDLSERLLTQADSRQLQESILAALCDQLRLPMAFIASWQGSQAKLAQMGPEGHKLDTQAIHTVIDHYQQNQPAKQEELYRWGDYWILPLRENDGNGGLMIGLLGLTTKGPELNFDEDDWNILGQLSERLGQVLHDIRLQGQLLEDLSLIEAGMKHKPALGINRYGYLQADSDEFVDWVHGALKDLWGGPKLAQSELLQLQIVQQHQQFHSTPAQALQAILTEAISRLKPGDSSNLNTPQWMLYNILEMRFLQGKKVRDVAPSLYMSEADFYRKQRIAIEEVAQQIANMERQQQSNGAGGEGHHPE